MTTGRRISLGWAVLLGIIAPIYIFTIRPGQTGGDFALYILHAANLVHGRPYTATGFISNPLDAIISPASYPPGFPLLIAPIYALMGLDLTAFKLIVVAAALAIFSLIAALAIPSTGFGMAATVALASAAMPALFDRRDLILSDIPFTLWCFAALLCCENLRCGQGSSRWLLPALAAATFMACATRTAGLALIAAILLICLSRRQGPWRAASASTIVGAAAAIAASHLLHVDNTTYLSYFAIHRETGLSQTLQGIAAAYGSGVAGAYGLSYGNAANVALLVILLLATCAGWLWRVHEDPGAVEAFLPVYAAMLLIFPVRFEPVRYLVPIAPLLIFYPAIATRRLCVGPGGDRLAICIVAAASVMLFVPYYIIHDPLRRPGSLVTDADSRSLYQAVMSNTDPRDRLLSANPRVLVLMTGRPSSIWPLDPTARAFRDYAGRIKSSWVIDDMHDNAPSNLAVHKLLTDPALLRSPAWARLIWNNARYGLWHLMLPLKAPPPAPAEPAAPNHAAAPETSPSLTPRQDAAGVGN